MRWTSEFAPSLAGGRIDTKFSRLVGKPPVIVAGMTPTTSFHGVELVAAALNAGYHAEFAAGGLSRPHIFRNKVEELTASISPGVGITINMIYINPRQWAFQFPLVLKMREKATQSKASLWRREYPTPAKAQEICRELRRVGIRYMSLKPGTAEHIAQCLDIARENPETSIIIQWTGGRGGGHHSFEDFTALS